ncbi:MAG: hypothetical protein WCP97_01215 [bacterium]
MTDQTQGKISRFLSRLGRIIPSTYNVLISKRKKKTTFWVLASFLPTFVFTRLLVYTQPWLFVMIRGTHIHHFTWGIIILAISGYLALLNHEPRFQARIALLYGCGLALAFDEFGMWLQLRDDYWVRQSYDAITIITAFLVAIVYFSDFWLKLFRQLHKVFTSAND